ncbi:conserved hypothetical protein [Leishmania infantum JPCM5]|uniref:IQ_calmodulin-binding_motif_containing_protein_-_putative n=2 Tax=Leishmania infantum TaxID=5671 RepID=A0A6L0XQW3_LEIIN|nr:conserved hypothetical protein [Leishmania infantum JPCM5]CAC9491902.1 IQ_calmodulin-binding_motif_containing_protein_-_putative [Leishmania infantum]CAM68398.1 conserved hypothetical protein [Leishmania infantum JPCM5]SUZ42219.1 IQ_calmodulin-binding_motif_containing_protein_-_putative [Leishmania infantum]|eukprot:XP_001465965.1 conserved hypothetical protein [Leishmania infantum JPCM5]
MDATHDRPPAGSAAVSVHAAFGSFSQARELTMAREQPLLALKAYSTWMRRRRVGASARAAALLDFTLYCNMFALQIWETEDVRPDAPLALARDYFQLVMDEFSALYKVVLPDLDAPETDADLASMPILDAKTDSVPGGLWAALLLTIGNQACVELRAGGDGVAKAERLFLLSRQLEGQMSDVPSLGWTWRIVRDLNAAVCAVMHCDFSQGEEAARSALALLETHIEDESADALSSESVDENGYAPHTSLLLALTHYTLGVATENTSCESSLLDYDRAIALASEGDTGSSLAALMSRARNRLAVYVEERQAKATLQAEEAAGAANAEKKGRTASRLKTGKATSSRRAPQKAENPRFSQSEQGLPLIVTPSIPDVLQGYLEKEGLTTTLVRVGALKDLYEVLARSLPGYEDCEALPQSLFAGTRFEAGAHESIFAVLFCTDTPLQWTLRLLDAAGNPVALRHSVWAPRPVLASLLMEMAAQRPPAPRSTAALQTRKEISDGNGKLRQQVIQMFAPPAAAPTVKQKAHEWVDAAVELLGQRLSLLLKTERAFEEQWIATERIRSALHTFAVPQDILRVKQELLKEKHLQERRQDRSARLIVHFFRHIVKQRTLGAEQTLVRRHRFEERVAAAVTLQKYIRRWCAYQEMGRRLAARKEYVEKIIRLQSLARRRAAARAYAELRESRRKEDLIKTHLILFSCAALQIQRMYRGHCARLRCYHLRGQMHAATLHHMRDSRNYYATVIQKCVRGMLARCQYGRAVYASRCYGRNAYKTQLWERSCVVIQRAYRACRSRRRLAGYRAAPQICGGPQLSGPSTAFSRHFVRVHTDGAVTADKKQAVAANRIQKMYRSCAAKRRLEALKYARRKELEAREEQPQWGARSTFSLKDCVF